MEGGALPRRQRVPTAAASVRPGLDRRHHLVALHQRGDLPGTEAGAPGLPEQQCRHVRARLPFADGLRAEDHLRHLGGHAGLRFRRGDGRRHRHRSQSDGRPPGLRLAAEEAAQAGGQADRHRSAPHRSRAHAACRGGLSPAAEARHQRRRADGARPCHRHGRPRRREIRARALRVGRLPGLGRVRLRGAQQPRGGREGDGRSGPRHPRGRPALRHRRQRGDLLRARHHRAQPGLDRRDGVWRTWRWRPATSAGRASA